MKQSKLKIAITGGIGSGKSTVCNIIKEMGYPVFSCDNVYAELLKSGYFTEDLAKEFGIDVLNEDGGLNRQKLSEIVFDDEEKLSRLNKITHPKIFEKMFNDAKNSESSIYFFEVPILFEFGYESLFDQIIVVMREEEQRIKSVMERDNLTRRQVVQRLKKQYNYNNCSFVQYYVIHNTGKIDDLTAKTKEILLKIISSF